MAKPTAPRSPRPPRPPSLADPGEEVPPLNHRTPSERDSETEEAAALAMLRSEEFAGASISLSRRPVGESDFGYLGELAPDTFSKETVRNVYGGGDYRAVLKNAQKQFVKNFSFKIDYRIPAKFPHDAHAAEKAAPAGVDLPAIISAIREAIPQPSAPAPADNTLLLEVMRQNAAIVSAALAQKPAGPDAMLLAQLAEMRAELRELKSGGGNGRGGLREALRDLQALQEITGGGGNAAAEPPSEKEEHWGITALKTLGPAFAPLLANMLPGASAGATPAGIVPDGAALASGAGSLLPTLPPTAPAVLTNPPTVSPSPSEPVNPLVKIYLSQFRTLAIKAAQKARDPYAWVTAKIDDIPEAMHGRIFELANSETWFADIFGADPDAPKNIEWLQEMRAAVLTFWLVADARAAYGKTPRPDPAAYASDFLSRCSVSFHDTAWNLSDPDGEAWAQTFADSGIDAVWLEAVRAAFAAELSDEEETPEAAPAAVADAKPAAPAPNSPPDKPARRATRSEG